MSAAIPNKNIPCDGSNRILPANGLLERVRYFLDQHPRLNREKFLLEAVKSEHEFSEQYDSENWAAPARRGIETVNARRRTQPPLTAEDIRLHTWLSEQLAKLRYERYGLWPRLRRLLFGKHS